MANEKPDRVRVWDPLVRSMHWVLVVAFTVAYLSSEEGQQLHVWSGYVVGAIIVLRVIWGFVGTRHARFSDFIYGPRAILRSLVGLFRPGTDRRYLGHNPAGGAMVFAMLIALAVTTWSGLEVLAIEAGSGPLASGVLPAAANSIPDAYADDEYGENAERGEAGGEEFWEGIHEAAANIMVVLVLLHILGVMLTSREHHENLVRSMIDGRKRRRED